MKEVSIIIIGAGPAGLAVAGRLSNEGISDYILLETSDKIGNSWHNHYDRLHLHTIKEWSHLPHAPFPDDYPRYVSRQQLVDYLIEYSKTFNIKPVFNQTVSYILPELSSNKKSWKVKTQSDEYIARHVIVATGVNHTPNIPNWSVDNNFAGDIVHSRFYKNAEPYKDKSVLVVGMGNTGAEIALDLSEQNIDVHLSVRSPISIVPRDLNGRPVQVTAKMLDKIPFGIGDWLGSQIRKVYFGNLSPYGLEVSKVHPTVQLRETGKTPIVDIGTVEAIKKGKIKVYPDVKSLEEQKVTMVDGREIKIDSIILATGYTAELKAILPYIGPFLDDKDLPKTPIGKADFEQLYFIGFDNYKVGGILGTVLEDSDLIVKRILTKEKK